MAFSWMPKHFRDRRAVMSASRMAVLKPRRCMVTASIEVTRLFAYAAFAADNADDLLTLLILFMGARKLSGSGGKDIPSPSWSSRAYNFRSLLILLSKNNVFFRLCGKLFRRIKQDISVFLFYPVLPLLSRFLTSYGTAQLSYSCVSFATVGVKNDRRNASAKNAAGNKDGFWE